MEPTNQSSPAIPIAIVCGFAMIALAIFFTNQRTAPTPQPVTATDSTKSGTTRPVSSYDYIRGNPNAPILMVEYSDYDCPFCMQFHHTMKQIMSEYNVTGKIAWVYRQFPLSDLHPNAPGISEAALCVGSLGGRDAFWKFSDSIFESRDLGEPTNVTKLPEFAEQAGVSKADLTKCLNDGDMKIELENQIADGFNAGARGTPYTVIIVGKQQAVINGAQSYDTVKGIVKNLIDQLDGNFDIDSVPSASSTPR